MKTWKIPVVWQEAGTANIVADTLAEAMEIARGMDCLISIRLHSEYVNDSWDLATEDESYVREYYNGGMED